MTIHIYRAEAPATNKIFLFDLDGTICISKSGRLYSYTAEDTFIIPSAKDKIEELKAAGYFVGIITNQSAFGPDVDKKILHICNILKVPVAVAAGPKAPRKPLPDAWHHLAYAYKIDPSTVEELHYCGDAVGCHDDHIPYRWSDSDSAFAANIGATFHRPCDVFDKPQIPAFPEFLTLTIMVGNPGSGKSTLARDIAEHTGAVHIEQDLLKVRPKVIKAARNALRAGKSVIVDATNATKGHRQELYELADSCGAVKRVFWCIRDGRPWNALRPAPIPAVAYHSYSKRFEDPRGEAAAPGVSVPVDIVY